jgi:hypothetical protein
MGDRELIAASCRQECSRRCQFRRTGNRAARLPMRKVTAYSARGRPCDRALSVCSRGAWARSVRGPAGASYPAAIRSRQDRKSHSRTPRATNISVSAESIPDQVPCGLQYQLARGRILSLDFRFRPKEFRGRQGHLLGTGKSNASILNGLILSCFSTKVSDTCSTIRQSARARLRSWFSARNRDRAAMLRYRQSSPGRLPAAVAGVPSPPCGPATVPERQ